MLQGSFPGKSNPYAGSYRMPIRVGCCDLADPGVPRPSQCAKCFASPPTIAPRDTVFFFHFRALFFGSLQLPGNKPKQKSLLLEDKHQQTTSSSTLCFIKQAPFTTRTFHREDFLEVSPREPTHFTELLLRASLASQINVFLVFAPEKQLSLLSGFPLFGSE